MAQITPWKGQDTAIRALAGVRAAGPTRTSLIVGKVVFGGKGCATTTTATRQSSTQLVEELDLGDAVHFLGQRTDVAAVLAALDLSLLPSWEEPFGLVTVESMAAGPRRW